MLVASLLLGSNSKAIKDKLSISAIPGKPPLCPIQLLDLRHFLSIKSFYPLMRCSSADSRAGSSKDRSRTVQWLIVDIRLVS